MSVTALTESRTFGRFLEHTRDNVLPGIMQTAIDSQPAVSLFFGRIANALFPEKGGSGRFKKMMGGATIEKKVRLGKNETVRELTGGYDTFDTTPQDNVRHARFNWKLYGGTINISGHEIDVNSSDLAVTNLVESEMRDCVDSLADLLGTHVYTGSGLVNRVTGLDELISSAKYHTSMGGLARATYTTWNSRGISADGTAPASIDFVPTTTSFASAGLANMRTAWNQASEGAAVSPDVILTTLTNHERYEGALEPQHRLSDMRMADAGIQALQFKTAPIIQDRKATSGCFYFLNSNAVFAAVLPGADFASTPFTEPDAQRVRISKVFLTAELCCVDPKRVNKLTGITA